MYNDFAIINETDFAKIASEYNKLMKTSALSTKNNEGVINCINEIMYQLRQLQNITKHNRHKKNISDIIIEFEKIINIIETKLNIKHQVETKSQQNQQIYCNVVKNILLGLFNLVVNIDKNEVLNWCKEELESTFKNVLNLLGECRYRW